MRKRFRGLTAILIALVVVLTMIPGSTYTVLGDIYVSYGDEVTAVDGESYYVYESGGERGVLKIPAGGVTIPVLSLGNGQLAAADAAGETASLTVTDSLDISDNAVISGVNINVESNTALNINCSASPVTIWHGGREYTISESLNGTVKDLGRTVTVVPAEGMSLVSGIDSETIYPFGTAVTAIYQANEGYYFPENDALPATNGQGQLKREVSNDLTTLSLTYTIGAAAAETTDYNITITLSPATGKEEQAAPAGLTDGGSFTIAGTTSAMEYAQAEDADTWTACADGSTTVTSGTWYVRYAETSTKKAGPAAEVLIRQPGSGSVSVPDCYYGEAPDPEIISGTNGTENITVEYKEQGAADSTYTQTVPTAVGDYTVRVTFAQTDAYDEAQASADFSISYLPVPENVYSISGTEGENGYCTTDVTITAAQGYLLSETLGGTYTDSLTFAESRADISLYFKRESTGAMTGEVVTIGSLLIDKEIPVLGGLIDGGSYYADTLETAVSDGHLSLVTVNGAAAVLTGNAANLRLSANNSRESYTIIAKDLAGNQIMARITVLAEWMKDRTVPEGNVELFDDFMYRTGGGSWQVDDDPTEYAGGIDFYIGADGEYTFSCTGTQSEAQ